MSWKAPLIPDARPARLAPLPAAPVLVPPAAANLAAATAPLRPFAGRPVTTWAGLRLLPLDGFHWGGGPRPGMPRTARVRGDHVLARITGGTLRLILPAGASDHGPGTVVFVPAGSAFATLPLTGAAGQVLLVPRDLAGRLGVPLPARTLAGAETGEAFAAHFRALDEAGDAAIPATALARVELISAALQRLGAAPAAAPRHRRPTSARALFDAFLALAGRELGRGRTMSDLAEALGTNAAGLDAACRLHRGCSALDVVYSLRLDRAREMLADRNCTLAHIAAELGFTGVAHLNRSFVAATGRSALAFRPA